MVAVALARRSAWKVRKYVVGEYLELEDAEGNVHRFEAKALIKGECNACEQTVYAESRIGSMTCPHCGDGEVEWTWGQARISFVPESEVFNG